MKILLVSSAFYPYPSGISEHVYHLAWELKKLGHSIKILTTNYPKLWPDKPISEIEIIRFGKVIFLPLNKSFATLPFSVKIPNLVKNYLKKEHFDIIHMHGCFPPEIGFWALHFSKSINCVTFHTVGFKKLNFLKVFMPLYKKYNKKIDGKIAVSEVAKKWVEDFLPGNFRVIPNGVDVERFNPNKSPFSEYKKYFPLILFVGRLDKRKGAEIAIKAFYKIYSFFSNPKLLIIGKGPEEKRLKKLVKKLNIENSCEFLGYVKRDDLPRYYVSCDIFLAPALGGEAQGIVLLEAMATKKLVIASDIEGYKTVVRDKENGLLFKVNSYEDLAQKILWILEKKDLKKKIEENAYLTAQDYSWEKIGKMVEDYYCYLKDLKKLQTKG
ncbi:MAG: glycosyltransferase family 4 protein [candidate division WOR-3 bacterium]|nr:glycosyltransferase family 4 protein [candidate division WOR-3 bacterium]MCX7836341.1 glycosyltransferase family 4 protein [candidate division WOR-3 bacterium]MDW8113554.1 glycosyltransferase family 4 protein [candidate division WOR-3 bacterium]